MVCDEAGDVCPPQPKNDPSFELLGDFAPGDLGSGLSVLIEFESNCAPDVLFMGGPRLGGIGFAEKSDMVEERDLP